MKVEEPEVDTEVDFDAQRVIPARDSYKKFLFSLKMDHAVRFTPSEQHESSDLIAKF